ncbi:trichohyalin isoform X2 [Synchiropus splendidus]|uniref:trichohyalin isoform X2 n=1 Tax=Synchiropus splendidus TaxID=270530 RepID=UPI00237D72FE|nr:trichohyalin isoform X2 [Synchiropus splendidus]
MGTKRPSGSIFDSLSGMIMSDRKHQPTGKTSRDPSPRLGMTERDRRREEEWQRDQEMDKRRDKARYKDSLDPRDRAYERDGAPVPRMREEDPARFREGERSRNGRPWSNVAVEPNREHEFKKCDTFPRMRKSTPERRREARNEERRYKTERRSEMGDQGRDFGRPRETYSDRQTDERRSRAKEDDRNFAGRNDMRRDKDFQDRSGRDAPRKGEKPRPDYEGKVVKRPSPQRRDDMDRRDRERRHRDTRSDGDSDERRERVRDKERIYQHSRSEGDSDYKTSRKPDYERPRYREEDGLGREDRRRDGDKRSERSREEDRRRERQEYGRTERVRRDERGDRREADTYKVQRQDREAQARDSDPRWGNQSGRVQEQGPRVPPRAQSSSEWSSDMDSDIRFRQGRDSYDESPERAVERGQEQQRRREIPAGERRDAPGNVNEQRRMWLEPKRDKMEKEDSRFRDRERQEESMLEGGNQQQVNKEPDESDKARDTGRERRARGSQTQGVSVDGEDVEEFCRELDSREHHSGSDAGMEGSQEQIDNSKESDREEGGSDYWPRSESEDGSDSDWRQERDRTVSGEDGFVTMSSGGDGEDEKEEEEEFVDCRDSWNSRDDSPSSAGDQRAAQMDEGVERDSRENKQKYIFCVIGQTLPRSKSGQTDLENPGTDTDYNMSSEPSEDTSDRQKQDANPHAEIGSMKRDSQTERLLIEWREKNMEALPPNPYSDSELNFEQILPALEGIDIEAMSPEEKEAIRIRMSGAWSLSEEPKRHSQAPHLKWAKDVIKEILGKSEEKTEDPNADSEASNRSEQGMTSESSADKAELGPEDSHSLSDDLQEELEDEELLELEGLRDDVEPSKSWGEVELRNVLDTIGRKKRNSRFFNAAQLYQQYSEAVQNSEILRQSRSDVVSISEETSRSPAPSPPPANRPLPPVPTAPHPQWLPHHGSISSVRSLPLPEPPRGERRPSSPRLSIVSITQSATLWRDLPGVRNSTELEEISEDQRRLQEVRFEVVTSEASYCRSLDIVVEHFVKSKQLAALLSTQDKNWLFSRMADVRAISHSFLSKLEERLESDIMHFSVCDIIARHCKRFKMVYVPYLTNQSYQDATYQRLMNENPGFKRIVEKLERSPVCQRLPLRSFLVLPFQRITRIKLLVQNIVKRTTPGTPEAMQAIIALKQLEKLIQESNDSISQMKSIESLVNLSAKVDFECRTLPLINPNRRLVREGPVTELMDFSLKETERIVYLHLFNDYLLLSLQKEGGRFTVIDHAPVSELRVENCRVKLHSLQKNLFRLYMSSKSLLLRTDTQSDKLRWISALSRPHPEVDFSCAQDFTQMQCIRAFVAQQPDELSLEKADIILAHQQSSDHWVEGTRLSDRHRGWVPEAHLETITNARVLKRNLADALKLTTATAEA